MEFDFLDPNVIARAEDELKKLSPLAQAYLDHIRGSVDGLTGLPNYRALQDYLTRAARHAQHQRYGVRGDTRGNVIAIGIDVDNFKQCNEEYGHHGGNKVLLHISERLQDALRTNARVFRSGGDEFFSLLFGVDNVNAALASLEDRFDIPPLEMIAGKDYKPTLSVGIYPVQRGDEPHGIYERANDIAAVAKLSGKNRVEIFRPF